VSTCSVKNEIGLAVVDRLRRHRRAERGLMNSGKRENAGTSAAGQDAAARMPKPRK
jgi:hypothetical protein